MEYFKSNKTTIGYLFFTFACCMWILTPFVGFFGFATAQMAIVLTVVVVLGEVFFVLSILCLGKAFWQKCKRIVRVNWKLFLRKMR